MKRVLRVIRDHLPFLDHYRFPHCKIFMKQEQWTKKQSKPYQRL